MLGGLHEKQLNVRTELTAVVLIFLPVTSQFLFEPVWRNGWTLLYYTVPPLSAKIRKLRLHFPHTGRSWTIETWENIGWCDDSRFLVKHLNGRFRILTLNSTKAPIRATFPWPPLGPLGPVDGHFKGRCLPEFCRRLFPSIYATLCHFLMAPSNRITPLVTKLQSCFAEHLRWSDPVLAS